MRYMQRIELQRQKNLPLLFYMSMKLTPIAIMCIYVTSYAIFMLGDDLLSWVVLLIFLYSNTLLRQSFEFNR